MIDPAQSFSNALNQGLGIMKSYRDEARQDEDRAFDKKIKMSAEKRLNEALQVEVERGKRQQGEYDFKYGSAPDGGPSRAQQEFDQGQQLTAEQVRAATAQADRAVFDADPDRMKEMYNLGVGEMRAGIDQRRASASSSIASANYYNQRARAEREASRREQEEKAEKSLFSAFLRAGQTGNADALRNSPAGLSVVGQIAANVLNVPSLMEAIENPTGNWVNDPKKVSQVFSFSRYQISKTAREGGLRTGGARGGGPTPTIQNPRAGSRNIDGRNVPTIEFEIAGVDAETGRPKVLKRYARTESLLDAGVAATKINRRIATDPSAQALLIDRLQADPKNRDVLNDIVEARVEQLEAFIKGKEDTDQSTVAARTELAQLTGSNLGAFPVGGTAHQRMAAENSRVVAQTIFRGLGRAFQD
jgi:hypothetical protein